MGDTEVERLIVRLMGDGANYERMLQQAQASTQQAAAAIQKSGAEIDKIEGKLASVGQQFKSYGRNLRTIGTMMSVAITAPLAGIGGAASNEAAQFEAALSRMEGLVGIAADEVEGFKKDILGLAGPVAKSPLELAKAMEFITGSGIKGKDALETLTISAKAASAGLGETVEVANAATSAMNAYGPANLSATKAVDILVAAVREGKAEASTFAPVFGQILPLANEMGVSFGEVGGALAFLTRTTGNASIATTQLRSMMTQLMRADMDKKLKSIGLSSKYVTDSIASNGLVAALRDLKEKAEKSGVPLKTLITDTEGLMAALQFTGPQAEIAATMIKTVSNAGGDTQKAFDAAAKTMKFQWNKTMAETKIIMIEIGALVQPLMGKMISFVHMGVAAWKDLSDTSKRAIVYMGGAAAAIGPTLVGLGGMTTVAGSTMKALGGLFGQTGLLMTALKVLSAIAGVVFSPWGAAIAGVVLVTGVLVQKFGGIQTVLDSASNAAMQFWAFIEPVFSGIGSLATTTFNVVWEATSNALTNIGSMFGTTFTGIGGWIMKTATWIRDSVVEGLLMAEYTVLNFGTVAQLAWLTAMLGVVKFGAEVQYLFTTVIPAIITWFGKNWKDVLFTAFDLATTVFINIGKNIVAIFSNLGNIITGQVSIADLWTPLTDGFVNTIKELPKIADREIGGLEKSLSGQVGNLQAKVAVGYEQFKKDKNLTKGVSDGVKLAGEEAKGAAEDAGKKVGGVVGKGLGDGIKGKKPIDAALAGSAEAISRITEYMDKQRALREKSAGVSAPQSKPTAKGPLGPPLTLEQIHSFPKLPTKEEQAKQGQEALVKMERGIQMMVDLMRQQLGKAPVKITSAEL